MSAVIFHGGGAAKVSNSYEEEWNLFCMLDVLAGLAGSMQIEVPGPAGVGFEFWIRRPAGREWHQVKAQISGKAGWTLGELHTQDVLQRFGEKLAADQTDMCAFVSADSAAAFRRLCAHSERAPDLATMLATYLANGDMRDDFDKLRDTYWKLADDEATWRWLRRIMVRTIDGQLLVQFVDERLAALVDAVPATARVALERVMEATQHNPVTTEDLWQRMEAEGCPRRLLHLPSGSVSGAIRERALAFRDERRRALINGTFIDRRAASDAIELLTSARPPRSILVSGDSGAGKSQVLGEIVSELLVRGVPVLTLDVSKLANLGDAESVGELLGLPTTPARSLAGVFADRHAVLVIDTLDRASSLSDQPITLLGAVGEVIRQARAHPNVVTVVGCRSFDLENDERLRGLAFGEESGERIDVPPFSPQDVDSALAAGGLNPSLTEQQRDLLRNAYVLELYIRLGSRAPEAFASRQDLEAAYAEEILSK